MFNDMTHRLRELADRVFKEGERTREAELMLLQSQINPHFLYNSLDTIYWMAERARATEIARMAMWLGRFYRLNLSRGRDTITMDQMVGQITSYLNIQQVRFRGRFEYSIRVADGLGSHGIPNLLVQPLVENAVYHGVEQVVGHGRIVLAVRKRAGKLQIVVHDNGAGIPTERLGALRRELFEPEETSCSYGLKNVHLRVRLKYGDRFGLHIESRPGRGTIVRLDIPEVKADA
jgi:two-component system sensor histidine kinase YesM